MQSIQQHGSSKWDNLLTRAEGWMLNSWNL